jgi:hypothetical protein
VNFIGATPFRPQWRDVDPIASGRVEQMLGGADARLMRSRTKRQRFA